MLWADFLYVQIVLVVFWHNNIGGNAARKMLVKLTTGTFERERGQ